MSFLPEQRQIDQMYPATKSRGQKRQSSDFEDQQAVKKRRLHDDQVSPTAFDTPTTDEDIPMMDVQSDRNDSDALVDPNPDMQNQGLPFHQTWTPELLQDGKTWWISLVDFHTQDIRDAISQDDGNRVVLSVEGCDTDVLVALQDLRQDIDRARKDTLRQDPRHIVPLILKGASLMFEIVSAYLARQKAHLSRGIAFFVPFQKEASYARWHGNTRRIADDINVKIAEAEVALSSIHNAVVALKRGKYM